MLKTILVPATGSGIDARVLRAASVIARAFTAHIDALHVRLDPVEVAVATASGDGTGIAGPMIEELIDKLQQDADKREAEARQMFDTFCRRERLPVGHEAGEPREVSAAFHVETGQESRWTASYGLTADIIVASRGTADDSAGARSLLEALLLETGRPLLIPTDEWLSGMPERIAIGWKPTAHAARAVSSAMPFIAAAKEVLVLSIEEENGRGNTDRLLAYLAWHGVTARAKRKAAGSHGAAQTLVSTATAAKAQLLVMGGYGHARLREWVFGGFTQHVLVAAPLPVLLAH